jgi:Leucine-rich repeat (LRR) protein
VKNDISNEGAKVLAKLKNIKALISNNVSYEGEKELNKLKNIGAYVDNVISAEDVQELAKPTSVNFNKYVRGNILTIRFCSTINISKLVSFLQSNPNITSLTLAGNNISNEGVKALANGDFTNLKYLDLSDNCVGDEGVKALADGNFTNLNYLDLSKNIIGNKGASALANGNLKYLTELYLTNNKISNRKAEKLAKAILTPLAKRRNREMEERNTEVIRSREVSHPVSELDEVQPISFDQVLSSLLLR